MKSTLRRQCKGCPWRQDVDPHDIPCGLEDDAAELLARWTANDDIFQPSQGGMSCHMTPIGAAALPCVGWLADQLGPGNNIALRMRARRDRRMHNWETDGPQRTAAELIEAIGDETG